MASVATKPLRDLVDARKNEIKEIVARHHGRSVAIFGSVARGDERPGSDIDFFVELAPGTRPLEILRLGAALEVALGVSVDVGTPESLTKGTSTTVWLTTPYGCGSSRSVKRSQESATNCSTTDPISRGRPSLG